MRVSKQIEANFKNVLSEENLSEFLSKIRTQIPRTVSNLQVMERHTQLMEELYIEPKEEQILGSFLVFDPDRQEHTVELEEADSRRNAGNNNKKQDRPTKQSAGMRDT